MQDVSPARKETYIIYESNFVAKSFVFFSFLSLLLSLQVLSGEHIGSQVPEWKTISPFRAEIRFEGSYIKLLRRNALRLQGGMNCKIVIKSSSPGRLPLLLPLHSSLPLVLLFSSLPHCISFILSLSLCFFDLRQLFPL